MWALCTLLCKGDIADPVLIDFHLAEEWPGDAATAEEDRGAYALYDALHDPRDDLLQVVRLLFFALTGDFQVPFRDWKMRPPHRCPPHGLALRDAARGRAGPLLRFFDRGFALDAVGRYQSAKELAAALGELRRAFLAV